MRPSVNYVSIMQGDSLALLATGCYIIWMSDSFNTFRADPLSFLLALQKRDGMVARETWGKTRFYLVSDLDGAKEVLVNDANNFPQWITVQKETRLARAPPGQIV